jgi:DNA-binding GntR family transcriptional regulator
MRLGHEGRLELIPNRGAFVPTPSLADARRVFEARRVLEAGIVATLAQGIARRDLEKLRRHLDAERRAAAAGRRHDSVKLSAAFHSLLGEIVGNPEIADTLERMLLPAQLLVSLYEPASLSHCAPTEHEQVVDALAAGDVKRAVAVMTSHLTAIEGRLAVPRERSSAVDLAAALGVMPEVEQSRRCRSMATRVRRIDDGEDRQFCRRRSASLPAARRRQGWRRGPLRRRPATKSFSRLA